MTSGRRRAIWGTLSVLVGIVVVFFAIRVVVDTPNVVNGTVPGPDAFERRYALHPVPAYVHIVPGVAYLVLAPLQLWRRFRVRHLRLHRLIGRIILPAGLLSGVFAVAVGIGFPYGGPLEAAASVVFGAYFVAALALAYRAVRHRDITGHRRWMIRAFAVGLGVGTIRIWIGLFQLVGLLSIQDNAGTVWFGVAFWLALLMHAVAAELYLRARPAANPDRVSRQQPGAAAGELGDLPLRDLGGQDRLRPVERAGPLVQLDRHARLQQAQRVGDVLVADRVELRGGDVGGRQARTGPRPAPVRRTASRASSPGSAATSRRAWSRVIQGVSVKLRADHVSCRSSSSGWLSSWKRIGGPCSSRARNATAAASPAPGAVPADRDPVRVDAELGGVLGRPGQHGVGVVQGGRERVLGGQPVAHRDHHHAGAVGDPGGPRVLGVQVAHDESAAVQPDDGALRSVRAVDPHRTSGSAGTVRSSISRPEVSGVGRRGGQLGEALRAATGSVRSARGTNGMNASSSGSMTLRSESDCLMTVTVRTRD